MSIAQASTHEWL